MGLLSLGTPLDWDSAQQYIAHVKKHGIAQFLNIWQKIKSRRRDSLIWGDEVYGFYKKRIDKQIEYVIVKMNSEKRQARLSLGAQDALQRLKLLQDEG